MKKLLCLILTLTMFFSTTSLAFSSTIEPKASGKEMVSFSSDTVITEDNVNEILRHYGLDPTKIDRSKDVNSFQQATVGDLEKALEEAKKLPKVIVVNDDNVSNIKNGNANSGNTNNKNDVSATAIITTGTTTAYKDATITSSLTVNYAATGKFYKAVSTYSTTKYWTDALDSDITTTSGNSTYYWNISSIRQNTNTVVNAYTTSSYLKMIYDYTATCYYGVRGIGGIPYSAIDVSGYTNFGTSYIP